MRFLIITESANALRLLMLFGVTGFFNAKKLRTRGPSPPQQLLPPLPSTATPLPSTATPLPQHIIICFQLKM